MYIDDVIDIIINAAFGSSRHIYNIVVPTRSKYEIVKSFERVTGHEINANYLHPPQDSTDPVYISDLPDLRTDWTRYTPLEEMIDRIVKLYQQKRHLYY